jgi:hypothetical protein
MTENFFKIGMAFMQKIFGAKIGDDILTAYWNLLKDMSNDEFKNIQQNLISTFIPSSQVPFPLPAHFLQAAGKSGESRAKLAVMAVISASYKIDSYYSVSFGDPALHETIDRFGGWPTLCRWSLDDWRFQEKNFIACYEAALISNSGKSKCIGIFESENSNKILSDEFKERLKKFHETRFCYWIGFNHKTITNKNDNDQKQIADGKGLQGIGDVMKGIKL